MPSEDTKILEFNQYQKPDKTSFITHANLGCVIKKINGCKNNLGNSCTTYLSEHFPLRFSMPRTSSFRSIGNKLDKN